MFQRNSKDFESFGGWHHGFGGGFRAGRGMMEPAILGALEEKPMHGYEIISYLEDKSHGMWRPSPGSVYPTLQLLEEKDYVVSKEVEDKKVYQLTATGKTVAKEMASHREHLREAFNERLHGGKGHRKILGDIMHLMRDIHHKGTPRQQSELVDAVYTFKDRLEQISKGES